MRKGSARPHAPRRPLVCLDDRKQAPQRDVVAPLPVAPGHPVRYERT